jgi:hypothetical protein
VFQILLVGGSLEQSMNRVLCLLAMTSLAGLANADEWTATRQISDLLFDGHDWTIKEGDQT